MRAVAYLLLAGVAVLLACSDAGDRGVPEGISGINAVVVPGSCERVEAIGDGAAAFFSEPQREAALALANDIATVCEEGDTNSLTSHAWSLLALIESALNAGHVASASAGPSLANALLACATSLCLASADPGLDLGAAFDGFGLFAVRGADTEPALARTPIPFVDGLGEDNSVLWGVEVVGQTWSDVIGANPVLVFGGPPDADLPLGDEDSGIPQYELNVFPDAGEFPGGQLFVGTCLAFPVDIGVDEIPRVLRENVILEFHEPAFCESAEFQTASIAAPFLALARSIMPASMRSRFVRGRAPGPGSGAVDFSQFGAVVLQTTGASLEFVVAPPSNVVEGEFFPVQVRALSAAGTAMESAVVELYILNNRGIPAGAVLGGSTQSVSTESLNQAGIAAFPGVSVLKPGAYRICARATLDDVIIDDVCAERINAKKAH